jgi:DNA mismatch repair ATPase MutS
VADDGAHFVAEGLAHPLLADAVPNDIRLDAEQQLVVVTGSNMSGKSTLLRAVGVNAVLALAGAPVRARSCALAPLHVAASIRTLDSLQDGASRFYAEITALRDVVALTGKPWPVLFLLDEMLAGTNSRDRRIGAASVVRGLLDRGALGMVTTHDLALAKLADELGPRAVNAHFECRLEAGELEFDYTLRPGVVRESNALELMRAVGLDVPDAPAAPVDSEDD